VPTVQQLFDLSGRAAIVTGGGTHLGKTMAEALAELGAAVYIASRRGDLCEQVAAELRKKPLPLLPSPWEGEGQGEGRRLDVTGLACDATNEAEVNALVRRVVDERGRLDVMVANAGGGRPSSYPPDGKLSEFVEAIEINMVSTYLCAQAAAREMVPKKRGSIIALGSIAAILGTDKRIYAKSFTRSGPHYMAAKGGVLMLTRALACEWGEHGITVNCISPGQIPKLDVIAPEQAEKFRQMNPLQRTGTPDDLKGTVALLASDAGRWITGQNIVVDGGWSAW
jgi:NAD(P)-dependent dehydrogenase (short-subunit alcohol dehydrogenase family)